MKIVRLSVLALTGLLAAHHAAAATLVTQNFATDPQLAGWQVFGDTNLFQWNSGSQNLAVTWDSAKPNSFFYRPLGVTLTSASNFMFAVDFRLQDIAGGTTPGKPQAFQVAVGLLNLANATNSGYLIGTGYQAPNIVELNYFPDSGYGASVTTPLISSANNFASGGFTFPLELVPGALYHAVLVYTADNQTLHTTLTSNGVPVGPLKDAKLTPTFGDFSVDTLSINSYSDEGQDTNEYWGTVWAGSILAHGTVEKLAFASPLPVNQVITAAPGGLQFTGTTNWNYILERTVDFQTWTPVAAPLPGVAGPLTLTDPNPPAAGACYRIRAELP